MKLQKLIITSAKGLSDFERMNHVKFSTCKTVVDIKMLMYHGRTPSPLEGEGMLPFVQLYR